MKRTRGSAQMLKRGFSLLLVAVLVFTSSYAEKVWANYMSLDQMGGNQVLEQLLERDASLQEGRPEDLDVTIRHTVDDTGKTASVTLEAVPSVEGTEAGVTAVSKAEFIGAEDGRKQRGQRKNNSWTFTAEANGVYTFLLYYSSNGEGDESSEIASPSDASPSSAARTSRILATVRKVTAVQYRIDDILQKGNSKELKLNITDEQTEDGADIVITASPSEAVMEVSEIRVTGFEAEEDKKHGLDTVESPDESMKTDLETPDEVVKGINQAALETDGAYRFPAIKNGTYTFTVRYEVKPKGRRVRRSLSGTGSREKEMKVSYRLGSLAGSRTLAGQDYLAGSGVIAGVWAGPDDGSPVQLTPGKKETVPVRTSLVSKDPSSGITASAVWIGYRFTIPRRTQSKGEVWFDSKGYAWLQNAVGGAVQPSYEESTDSWVLEGRTLASNGGAPVLPGEIEVTIILDSKNTVASDTTKLKTEAWIITDGIGSTQTEERNITFLSGDVKVDLIDHSEWGSIFSGYYNQSTGSFSLSRPADTTGFVFGRVYRSNGLVWNFGGEKLDPTQPITWETEYKLTKMVGGVETEETDPAYQPVILGMKSSSGAISTSQLPESVGFDMTLGGVYPQILREIGGFENGSYYHGGDYTFTRVNSNTLKTSAVLSAADKESNYNAASDITLIFVPASIETPAVNRKLTVVRRDLFAKTYSGMDINVEFNHPSTRNQTTYDVSPKADEDSMRPVFSKVYVLGSDANVLSNGDTAEVLSIVENYESNKVDFNINGVNQLIKFESGLEVGRIETNNNSDKYSGDINVLYAVKADGTGWKDETELNHTQDFGLRYYETKDEAENYGTVVGILVEYRGGVWTNSEFLSTRLTFRANGEAGKSYAVIQDIKIWRGSSSLSVSDSYTGTNGAIVTPHAQLPKDEKFAHQNPSNTTGIYRKDIWPEDSDRPVQVETTLQTDGTFAPTTEWGETIWCIGGAVTIDKMDGMDVDGGEFLLNGTALGQAVGSQSKFWPTSTFDINKGERVADRALKFTVSGVGDQSIYLKASLERAVAPPFAGEVQGSIEQFGAVRLHTKDNPVSYRPGTTPGMQGRFEGGILIDDLNQIRIPGNGEYAICYSSKIGDVLKPNTTDDVKPGQYWRESKLTPVGRTNSLIQVKGEAVYGTSITKTASFGASKVPINIAGTDEAGFLISLSAESREIKGVRILDVLPVDEDERGNSFTGTYKIKDGNISLDVTGTSTGSAFKVFYTESEDVRTAGDGGKQATATIFNGMNDSAFVDGFITNGTIEWKMAAHVTDNLRTIPLTANPTAILVYGDLAMGSTLSVPLWLKLNGNGPGDSYRNSISTGRQGVADQIPSGSAGVTVVGRKIFGKAWVDLNRDGVYQAGSDRLLPGVRVKIYRADGTEISANANGLAYHVITDANGAYKIEKVPESPGGYYVVFESEAGLELDSFKITQKYAGGAEKPGESVNDSDIYENSGQIRTDVFSMPNDDTLRDHGIVSEDIMGINAGVIPRIGKLRISKRLVAPTSDLTQFSFQIELKDIRGAVLGGKYPFNKSDGSIGTVGNGDSFTLRGGETYEIKDLPEGTEYKITEAFHPDYRTLWEGQTGQIGYFSTAEAVCTNQAILEVTFKLDGYGAIQNPTDPSDPRTAKTKVLYGERAVLPQLDLTVDPDRELLYWVDENENIADVINLEITEPRTFTAKFKEKIFTVQFIGRSNRLLKTELVKYGRDATPPSYRDPRFDGWNDDYTNVKEDKVIYAEFWIRQYNRFPGDVNKGPGMMPEVVKEGNPEVVKEDEPVLVPGTSEGAVVTERKAVEISIPENETEEKKTLGLGYKVREVGKNQPENIGNTSAPESEESGATTAAAGESKNTKQCRFHFVLFLVAGLEGLYYGLTFKRNKKRLRRKRDQLNERTSPIRRR